MKVLFLSFFLTFFLIFSLAGFYILSPNPSQAQSMDLNSQKVIYEMPYAGILPDHPLYFLKIIRDRLQDFFTRDKIKKAQLYLNFSDKRFVMAEMLAQKGKNKLALDTLSKGEKYFLKIPDLLKSSKKQGVSPPDDLVFKLKLSNAKHKEIIEDLIKELPQGQHEDLKQVLQYNSDIKSQLDSI